MFIYSLADSADGVVRYIGFTSRALNERLKTHIKDAKAKCMGDWKFRNHRVNWLRSVINAGSTVVISEIEKVDSNNWKLREQHWIAEFKKDHALVNSTDGGDGTLGYIPTSEARRKLSETSKRTWSDPVTRAARLTGVTDPSVITKRNASIKRAYQSLELATRGTAHLTSGQHEDARMRGFRLAQMQGRVGRPKK